MFNLTGLFGSRNERTVKQLRKRVTKINALEPALVDLSDDALKAKVEDLKTRAKSGAELDTLLDETFACVREASKRTLGLRHFDSQLIGGMVLHSGKIAEMATGEGKTLVATLAACLNALSGRGVHIVTVNDYLARRDAQWMKPIYEFMGMTVAVNVAGLSPDEKRAAYAADITYGTNSEFGFDYLRDNMAFSRDERSRQRDLNYAIVDEVDSILIDEARTPLIISGSNEGGFKEFNKIAAIIPKLIQQPDEEDNSISGDYTLDLKAKQAHITELGHEHLETLLFDAGLLKAKDDLYATHNLALLHHVNAAIRAHTLYSRDVDYIVDEHNEVVIVDEHTGRTMQGRRWSDGLHQAIEAKEGVPIQSENRTLASITYQNFFRLYPKLAGMTGTADTEAFEFSQIYGLEVVVIPTNRVCARIDSSDLIYQKAMDKYRAIIEEIKKCRAKNQPVLVGTTSIENSEVLSKLLNKEKIPHHVLNAKYHEKEAYIIMEAGKPGAVTIATNMAGRGTDIVLGGNMEAEIARLGMEATEQQKEAMRKDWEKRHATVLAAGGLHVIGSERHESRRIDNQLRGRSGRQGDPGSTQFFLSLEDGLMRIFASDRMAGLMQRLGLEHDQSIESKLVTRAIEKAQKRVEAYHFDIRKQLLEFDDVANEQRKVIYQLREMIMQRDDLSDYIADLTQDVFTELVYEYMPQGSLEEQWDIKNLTAALRADFNLDCPVQAWLNEDRALDIDGVIRKIIDVSKRDFAVKEATLGADMMRKYEKGILLHVIDTDWREHLGDMENMRQSIGLRGFAQKDPKQEYKREGFALFSHMIDHYKTEAIKFLMRFTISDQDDLAELERRRRVVERQVMHKEPGAEEAKPMTVRIEHKVGRNEVCFCGSGKKYKYCHGSIDSELRA